MELQDIQAYEICRCRTTHW